MTENLAMRRRAASSRTSGRSGRKYHSEERELRLLVRFADEHRRRPARPAHTRRCSTTSSRPGPGRGRAASTICWASSRCLLDWAVTQRAAGGLAAADPPAPGDDRAHPVPVRPRPGPSPARRRGRAARQPAGPAARPDLPRDLRPLLRARAARRRGLRAAPRRRRRRTGSSWSCGAASSARAGSSRTGRASASWSPSRPRAGAPTAQAGRRRAAVQLRRAAVRASRHRQPDVPPPGDRPRPRRSPTGSRRHGCTDLRHSFAVGCLLRWYREGLDPSARLYQLSTFMGHVDPVSTAVYLTITPQLLDEANQRFEAFAEPAWPEAAR